MHRQPTPDSIAAAEANLGDVSPEKVKAAEAFMTRVMLRRLATRVPASGLWLKRSGPLAIVKPHGLDC
jgi:hypothetical protein